MGSWLELVRHLSFGAAAMLNRFSSNRQDESETASRRYYVVVGITVLLGTSISIVAGREKLFAMLAPS